MMKLAITLDFGKGTYIICSEYIPIILSTDVYVGDIKFVLLCDWLIFV